MSEAQRGHVFVATSGAFTNMRAMRKTTKATMMTKGKKLVARGMVRSETYGPSRMNY